MVGFQEVVEIWGVYWFGRRLGRGWGILVWQSGKRSSENGFQTTFGKRDSQLAIQQITTLSNEILTT